MLLKVCRVNLWPKIRDDGDKRQGAASCRTLSCVCFRQMLSFEPS